MQSNILSERLKELRIKRNMTQGQVADKMHQQRQVISYYETGSRTPNIEDLKTFASLYNTTTDYLLGLTEIESNKPNITMICEYTGLTEMSLNTLKENKNTVFCRVPIDSSSKTTEMTIRCNSNPVGNDYDIFNRTSFHEIINKVLGNDKFIEAINEVIDYKLCIDRTLTLQHQALLYNENEIIDKILTSSDSYKDSRYHYHESIAAFRACVEMIVNKEFKECNENAHLLEDIFHNILSDNTGDD